MPRARIELATPAFSVLCSTDRDIPGRVSKKSLNCFEVNIGLARQRRLVKAFLLAYFLDLQQYLHSALAFTYERYQITLPDGFQVREIYDRCREQSLLFLLS